jgi:predicted ATPase
MQESPDEPLLTTLARRLAAAPALLVLDNLEQLPGIAPQIAELLAGAPGLRVLATSRTPLRLREEREFPVPPLPGPDPDDLPELPELARCRR